MQWDGYYNSTKKLSILLSLRESQEPNNDIVSTRQTTIRPTIRSTRKPRIMPRWIQLVMVTAKVVVMVRVVALSMVMGIGPFKS